MKRFLTYLLSGILCLFFLFAGTGLNVVHYCCAECRAAGIEHVSEESCEAIHHHHEHHHDGNCHHSNGCWMKHLTVDQGGVSASLTCPQKAVHQTLFSAEQPILTILSPIHADCEHDLLYDTSPNDKPTGQSVLIEVCRWLI